MAQQLRVETQVQFPESTSSSLQLPVIPASEDLMPLGSKAIPTPTYT